MDFVNEVLHAVSISLQALFPDLPVYIEDRPQEPPDGYILLGFEGDPELKLDLGRRYVLSGKINIAYRLPSGQSDAYREMNRIFARLALELRVATSDRLRVRVEAHQRHIAEETLHDICPFTAWIMRVDTTPAIGKIDREHKEVQ